MWFFAPPSACTRLPCFAAVSYTYRAIGVEPTKLTARTSGCSSSASTATLSPCTTLNTPSGSPASASHSATRSDADGSRSDGFSTNVLPHAIDTGHIHIGTMAGKLNGVMPAHTPRGWRREWTSVSVDTSRRVLALHQVGDPAGEIDDLEPAGDLPERVGHDLAVLCADDPSELVLVPLGDLAKREHHPGPPAERRVAPLRERLCRNVDSRVHVGRIGERHPRLHGAGRGIEHVAGALPRALPLFAADPVAHVAHDVQVTGRTLPLRCRGHTATLRLGSPNGRGVFTCDDGDCACSWQASWRSGSVPLFVAPAGAGSDKGTLRVATSLPAPGFWNGDTPSSLDGGFEYELAQQIGEDLGYSDVKISNVSFDALVAGKAKGFDFALSQVSITPERAEVVLFSTPYYRSDNGILVNTGTTGPDAVEQQATPLGRADRHDAGRLPEEQAEGRRGSRACTRRPRRCSRPLKAEQVDAVMTDTSILLAQAGQADSGLSVVGQFKTNTGRYGAVMPKGSKIKADLNAEIKKLADDGTLAALEEQWLVPEFKGNPSTVPYLEI